MEGLKSVITRTINGLGRKSGKIKEQDGNIPGEFIREGLTAVINVQVRKYMLVDVGDVLHPVDQPEVVILAYLLANHCRYCQTTYRIIFNPKYKCRADKPLH